MGEMYSGVSRKLFGSPQEKYITNKTPLNFLFIPIIRAMLPHAKIIHCFRNPMDNCLSIFREDLEGASHRYAYNFEELGEFYNLYRDYMAYWTGVLPEGSIYQLEYEQLVSHQEEETRNLLEYCDLPWDAKCLEFHKTERRVETASASQVRKPIYTSSVEGWRRYEKQLQPLANILGMK